MNVNLPFLVFGQNALGDREVAVVEVDISVAHYLAGEHYAEAALLAQEQGLKPPMVAFGPEEVGVLADSLGTLKQLLVGRERLQVLLQRARQYDLKNIREIA
ncbi:hypothetical protein RBE51_19835 [Pseudomonas taiwanensis]|uniref:hypothetical protein n=1 Tax=Pseudomonas taiwanensis TaxID=470150 RepID=UPI0028E042B8|nr:hypothetical protein [Pseudomonas taiwanensis]MDT8925044.1 hypothetical protein [Pseudomonas taiwanensis]